MTEELCTLNYSIDEKCFIFSVELLEQTRLSFPFVSNLTTTIEGELLELFVMLQ